MTKYIIILLHILFINSCASIKHTKTNKDDDDCPKCSVYIYSDTLKANIPIARYILKAQTGIICDCICNKYNTNAPCEVSSYKLLIFFQDKILYSTQENSCYFTPEIKERFNDLKSGDSIIIYDIFVSYLNKTQLQPSLVYKIK